MNKGMSDFTQGSILKKLCWFMLPVLGALVLQAAYGAVDLLVVGRFGSTSGLSAVSTGSQVLNLVTFVVTQLAMGVTVLIARYLGEKKPEKIPAVLGGATIVFAMVSVVLFILLVFFARPIAVLMQASQESLDLTVSYVRICGCGIFFIVAYNMLSAVFRGLGDSNSPLIFVLIACIVNIFGDLFLVAGLHLDAAGAAFVQLSCHGLLIPATLVIPVDLIHQQFGHQSLQMLLFPLPQISLHNRLKGPIQHTDSRADLLFLLIVGAVVRLFVGSGIKAHLFQQVFTVVGQLFRRTRLFPLISTADNGHPVNLFLQTGRAHVPSCAAGLPGGRRTPEHTAACRDTPFSFRTACGCPPS